MTNDVYYTNTSAHALIGVYLAWLQSKATVQKSGRLSTYTHWIIGLAGRRTVDPVRPNSVASRLDRIFSLALQDRLFRQFHFDTM
jgi:hypothetical protein